MDSIVAIDAMGGDNAPEEIVAGAAMAASQGVKCLLVGDENRLNPLVDGLGEEGLEVIHAPERIEMDDTIPEVFRKKQSSLMIAIGQHKAGKADAIFSAGNTGALVVSSRSLLELMRGVEKAGIAIKIPTRKGKDLLLIDAGASTDCSPNDLLVFGLMGKVYSRELMGVDEPAIGLVNIGEESFKGDEVTRAAYSLFRESGLNFAGNVEGNSIADRIADVLVCDGFIGNTILKVAEGTIGYVTGLMRKEFMVDMRGKIGAMLLRPAFARLKKKIDWKEVGGGVILGMKGNVVIGHGRSDAEATCNAVKLAGKMARSNLWEKIEKELETIDA